MDKIFLNSDKRSKFHLPLKGYLEIIAWDMEVLHPENFGGCLAYFNKNGLKDAYTIDYFWITEDKKEVENDKRSSDEEKLRYLAQQQLYQIANTVQAVGGIGIGHKLFRDYSGLDDLSRKLIKTGIIEDTNLTRQLAEYLLRERIINGNKIVPNNFFYYELFQDSPFYNLVVNGKRLFKRQLILQEDILYLFIVILILIREPLNLRGLKNSLINVYIFPFFLLSLIVPKLS